MDSLPIPYETVSPFFTELSVLTSYFVVVPKISIFSIDFKLDSFDAFLHEIKECGKKSDALPHRNIVLIVIVNDYSLGNHIDGIET